MVFFCLCLQCMQMFSLKICKNEWLRLHGPIRRRSQCEIVLQVSLEAMQKLSLHMFCLISTSERECMQCIILFHFYHNFCPLSSSQTKTFKVAEIIFQFPTFPLGEYTVPCPHQPYLISYIPRVSVQFNIYRRD